MNKIFVVTALSIILSISSFAQNIEYGAVVGATKGIFFNTIESFDDEEFKLTSGMAPVFGIYGQRRFNDLLALNWEIQLSSHEVAFSHILEDEFVSYNVSFEETISQVKVLFSNNLEMISLADNNRIMASVGLGGSLHTFSASSWSEHVSLKQEGADSLYNHRYSTSDHLGMKKFIPEGFVGITYEYNKKALIFKNMSIRLTYHYLFRKAIETPTQYSLTYYKNKAPYKNYEASWAGRLTYFDLVLRLAVF